MSHTISKIPLLLISLIVAACVALPAATPAADVCTDSSQPEACNLYRSQLRATMAETDRQSTADAAKQANQIKMEATQRAADLENASVIAQAQATAAIAQAEAQAETDKAKAQQDIVESQQRLMNAQALATSQAISNSQQATQSAFAFSATATKTAADNMVQATRSAIAADAARNQAQAERDSASLNFWGTLIFAALAAISALVLIVLAGYYAALWLRRRGSQFKDDRGNTYLLIGRQLLAPGLTPSFSVSIDGHTPMSLEELSKIKRRQQFADIAHEGIEFEDADQPIDGEYKINQPSPAAIMSSAPALPSAPSFAELLRTWQPTPDKMLLGFSTAGPVYCKLSSLLSTGIVGRPGQGKTTVLRFVFAQSLMVGAKVTVWDLHHDIAGSLPGADVHVRLERIEESAQGITDLLKYRIHHELYNEQPVMLLADEFPLLAPASEIAQTAINRIILEGRKVQMFGMVSGQGLPADLFRGTLARDALSSRFILHTSTRTAQAVSLPKEALPWVIGLTIGYAVVDGPVDPTVIAIPNTTKEDIKALFPASLPISAMSRHGVGNGNGHGPDLALDTAADMAIDPALIDKRARVKLLIRSGSKVSDIIKTVWGVSAGSGYISASSEFNLILASLMPQE